MKRLSAVSAIALSILSGLEAADLIPLQTGSYWIYRHDRSAESFTVRVGQPVWGQTGKLYHSLVGYTNSPVIARIDEAGNLAALDPDTGKESVIVAFAGGRGEWWDAPGRDCIQQGQTQPNRTGYKGPGGSWSQTLEVQYRSSGCADAGVTSEQFAENIGMLRRVVSSIAGSRTFDLVYARIGTQIVETSDRARFSLSVDQRPDPDYLFVTLRVDIGYTPHIRLRFPSAKIYDVAVRDPSGKVVWTWSDGKAFDLGIHEEVIGNLWSAVVPVPRLAGDMQDYWIEGWLATAPEEPKFAATAPAPPPRVAEGSRTQSR